MSETKNYPVIVSPPRDLTIEEKKDIDQELQSQSECDNERNKLVVIERIKKIKEQAPRINKFMIDINAVRRRMLDLTATKEDVEKLEVLMECIALYENPHEIELIKEYYEEKEKNKNIQNERKRRMDEYDQRYRGTTNAIYHGFPDFNNTQSYQSSSDEEICENLSEDEFKHDEYIEMLDTSLKNLGNSILQRNFQIQRYYVAEMTDGEKNKLWDDETDDDKGKNEMNNEKDKKDEKDEKCVTFHIDNGNEADDETSDSEIEEPNVNLSDIEIIPDPTDEDNDGENDKEKNKKDFIHQMALSMI